MNKVRFLVAHVNKLQSAKHCLTSGCHSIPCPLQIFEEEAHTNSHSEPKKIEVRNLLILCTLKVVNRSCYSVFMNFFFKKNIEYSNLKKNF